MEVVLLLLTLVAGALLLLVVQRLRRRLPPWKRERLGRSRTLFDLQIGDIVQAEAGDWVVEERLCYDQDGFQWLEYLLRDGPRQRWLVVCEDDWLELSWLEAIELDPPASWPLPRQLDWRGMRYRLQEQGEAVVQASQRQLNRRPGHCHFADYSGPDGQLLALEIWGEPSATAEIEAFAGSSLDPLSLTLLPGDGRRVYRP